jgi:predicted RNA binding protein YcfA (HicA-like mRNA interferase family)
MRLPRDLSGTILAKKLKVLGYDVVRQSGSHIRLSTELNGEHHITIPAHESLRVGTLNGIFSDIAAHFKMSKEELLKQIFD